MNMLSIVKIVRQYFEITLATRMFQIGVLSSNKFGNTLNIKVILRPYYGEAQVYQFLIDLQSGEIKDIKLIKTLRKNQTL